MRKVLLATTALVGVAFAGAANAAATSPISLNVGGYTDFVAGFFHEAQSTSATPRANRDFETEFKLNFDAMGKGSNGIEYGANVSLWNGSEVGNTWTGGNANGLNTVEINSAYVWLSGAFGKVLFGDERGASDLVIYAPTVGEGQTDGRFTDFLDPTSFSFFKASGIDNTEHSTKITYYTPKVGNDMHKVQVGGSYAMNMYDYGQNVSLYKGAAAASSGTATSPYHDYFEGAIGYWGNWHPVTLAASLNISTADAGKTGSFAPLMFGGAPVGFGFHDFTAWGVGAQLGFAGLAGLTIGGSYQDLGRYGTTRLQNKDQEFYSLGAKYEFDKVGVAANWLTGEGYNNLLGGAAGRGTAGTSANPNVHNYVSSYDAFGAGATYTWFPGLTSNIDGVLFFQNVTDQTNTNEGFVLLLSQKLTF